MKYWIELSFSEGMLNRTQPLKRTCQLFFNFCKYRKMELASSIAALNQIMHSYGTPPVKLAHISFCECLNWWAVYARAHTVSSIGYMEFSPQMLVYPIQQPNSYLNPKSTSYSTFTKLWQTNWKIKRNSHLIIQVIPNPSKHEFRVSKCGRKLRGGMLTLEA